MHSTDIFLWANNLEAVKDELQVQLYLINKRHTVYQVRHPQHLPVNSYFLNDLLKTTHDYAEASVTVRDAREAYGYDGVLPHATLDSVKTAEYILHQIESLNDDILEFSAEEHDFKRIKGVIAHYTHPKDESISFHVVKFIPQAHLLTKSQSWRFHEGLIDATQDDAIFKIPADNQVLVVDTDIFAFNLKKFEKVFDLDIQQDKIVREKGALIDQHYKISTPTFGQGIAFMAEGGKSVLKKLAGTEVDNLMSQEQVLDIVDEMGVELMTDDTGAIILMDHQDVSTLLDVINDNYVRGLTGNSYLAKSKKPFDEAAG